MRMTARSSGQRAADGERRRGVRRLGPSRFAARVVRAPNLPEEWAMVRNLSARGIALVLRSEIAPGSGVEVRLRDTVDGVEYQVSVRILHVFKHRLGSYVAGGMFTRRLTPQERRMLITTWDRTP